MSQFDHTFHILSSGLSAERVRVDLATTNLANAHSTHTEQGAGPYRRLDAVFQSDPVNLTGEFIGDFDSTLQSVKVQNVVTDTKAPIRQYQPNHPDADKDGYVLMPNVNMVEEMVNMMQANRSYDANISSLKAVMKMVEKTLELGK